MALQLVCPSCRADVVMDEALAGREVLCPRCSARFTAPSIQADVPAPRPAPALRPLAPAPQGPEPAHFDDDADLETVARSRRADDYGPINRDPHTRWRTTVVGLGMMFWTTLGMLALLAPLVVLAAVAGEMDRQGGPPRPEQAVVGVGIFGVGCLLFLTAATYFVGMCLCCSVPAESGAKGRALTAVIAAALFFLFAALGALALIFYAASRERQGMGPPGELIGVLVLIGLIFLLVILVSWMLFHRAIGVYFENRKLARSALWYLISYFILSGTSFVLFVAARGLAPRDAWQGIAACFSLVANTTLFIWFLIILRRTRTTIIEGTERHARRAFERE